MKFKLIFKTPDIVENSFGYNGGFSNLWCGSPCEGNQDGCDECDRMKEKAHNELEEMKKCISPFVKYEEQITIEFDTEAGTATVVPLRKE